MKDEIKENLSEMLFNRDERLLDCITNLQEKNNRLLQISRKMHTWIFLNSNNEQEIYDELGLTPEENALLGYSGQFRIGSDKE